MAKLGFKEINQQSWLEPDDIIKAFVKLSSSGEPESMSGEDWLQHILKPKLLESVPQDVQAVFEVARGALVYGYFFYPLYTLAAEQLFRVAEAAISHKCKALGAPKSKDKFGEKIKWLSDKGIIPQADIQAWNAIRKLRNYASHPERQSIITPGMAIGSLEHVTEKINSLFSHP
jgi:hypothetical protein